MTPDGIPKEWSNERLVEQFKLEVRQRFEEENAKRRAADLAEVQSIKAEHAAEGKPCPDWLENFEDRNSFYWETYEGIVFKSEYNSVQMVLPKGFAIFTSFLKMFEDTSVAWSYPSIEAWLIDGEPRVVIDVMLIDYWDDERHAKWFANKAIAPTG